MPDKNLKAINVLVPADEHKRAMDYCRRRTERDKINFSLTSMVRLALAEFEKNHEA